MQVFKFGGASIRNTKAIRNMAEIIQSFGENPLVIVVSAMGKTTRALEDYIDLIAKGGDPLPLLTEIRSYHYEIIEELFKESEGVHERVNLLFAEMAAVEYCQQNHSKFYDRIVSTGEKASSCIVYAYLNSMSIECKKIDATELITCTGSFQNGIVEWPLTEKTIHDRLLPILDKYVVVTQGFIGSTAAADVITLGKEGSDFTAAIFGACLDAEKVTIWKDVPGILSADPKLIDNAKQILHLPYTEASEMTYYGASVIHPKTIKPLANKNIPLYVRSFDDPLLPPTKILGRGGGDIEPTIIFKKEQCLFTLRVRDYTFVDEKSLAKIFNTLDELDISLNILQSSAITISVCFDYKKEHIEALFDKLEDLFSLQYMTDLELVTLKNYNDEFLKTYRPQREIILEQRSRRNCRFLVKMEAG